MITLRATSSRLLLSVALFLLSGFCAARVAAHEGEDHGAPEPVSADLSEVVRAVTNENYELVLKYRNVKGELRPTLRFFLNDYLTNAPTAGAGVTLRTTGTQPIVATAKSSAAGVYTAELVLPSPGLYGVIVAIQGSPTAEFVFSNLPFGRTPDAPDGPARRAGVPWWVITLATIALGLLAFVLLRRRRPARAASKALLVLLILGSGAWMEVRSGEAAQGRAGDSTTATGSGIAAQPRYMPKESQFFQGVRTISVRIESLRARINAIGHVVPEGGALAKVTAPVDGRFERGGPSLAVGQRVRRGAVLGTLLLIDRLTIRAPISGLIAEVNVASGQWVQAGQDIAVIVDERRVRVEVPLFGENLNQALSARTATVTSSALPGIQFLAHARGLAPTAPEPTTSGDSREPAGSSIPPLLFAVENRGGLLRPGMLVETSMELPASQSLIAVPEAALVYQETGAGVFVHTAPEVFELRPVKIAGRFGTRVGIAGDISAGDRIVVEGAPSLAAAPPVTTAPKAAAKEAGR
ncbi:MAG: HlyD family efflux transporter periplasmic adaptor subunit [Candidatus Eisenbacteria bacterium]